MIARGSPQRGNWRPVPGTMEAYAAEFDARLRHADIREVRTEDRRRRPRASAVLPKATRRPRSQ